MLIVITGLDGSGTSSIAQKLHELDPGSTLLRTPPPSFKNRANMDELLHDSSPVAHMMYYLSADTYASDVIRDRIDYKNHNVYLVRYLIDTVVSSRVHGIPMKLDYNQFGHQLLEPDLTIFVSVDEETRQKRLAARGKDNLDRVLDDIEMRDRFLEEFDRLLDPKKTIYISNQDDLDIVSKRAYQKIRRAEQIQRRREDDRVAAAACRVADMEG